MKNTLLLSSLLLWSFISASQDMSLVWAKQIGGTSNQVINSIAYDAFNNYVVVGHFDGIVDFDPSAGISQSSSIGQNDAFVAKYDAAGNFLWKYVLGNTGHDYAWDCTIDVSGNVYVTGELIGEIDIDQNAVTPNVDNQGSGSYGFVIKLGTTGNHLWSKIWDGSSGNYNRIRQIALDNVGNIVVAGETVGGPVDLDPGVATTTVDGSYRLFYEKLTSTGNLVWYKSLTGYATYDAIYTELILDADNNIYMCGHFQSIIDFDPSSGTYEFNGNGPADGFIVKYTPTGDFTYVKTFVSQSSVYVTDIDLDANGNLVASGSYTYSTDFDPDLINIYNLDSQSNAPRGFLLKLDANGIFNWVTDLTSAVESMGTQVCFDNDNNIIVAGYYSGNTADLDPTANTWNASYLGGSDIFISKYDMNGNFEYANNVGSTGADRITCMQFIEGTSKIATAGYFESTIDMNPNTGTTNLTSAQGYDGFVAIFSECSAQTTSFSAVGCGEYLWNNTYYIESGLHTQTLIASTGCDSIVTLDLTIAYPTSSTPNISACGEYAILDQVLTSSGNYELLTTNTAGCDSIIFLTLFIEEPTFIDINVNGNLLNCTEGDSYQWVNCIGDGEYSIIENATEQTFAPTESGVYSVLVENGICSNYATCVEFTYIGINEVAENRISAYPNPANDQITITLSSSLLGKQIQITNSTGQIVESVKFNTNTKTINISELASGIYHIHAIGDQENFTAMFIKM
jgi:hypothetical protein